MTNAPEKQVDKKQPSLRRKLRRIGAVPMIAIVCLVIFLVSESRKAMCYGTAMNEWCTTCFGCAPPGSTASYSASLTAALRTALITAATAVELHGNLAINAMQTTLLTRVNTMEENLMSWWDMWWAYDYRPSLQDQTAQMGASESNMNQMYASFIDSQNQNAVIREKQIADLESERTHRVNENACTAGTMSGGMARANAISRAGRLAVEGASTGAGVGEGVDNDPMITVGSPVADDASSRIKYRYARYKAYFCNPDDNNGVSACSAATPAMDLDINASELLVNRLTINYNQPEIRAAVFALIDNLTASDDAQAVLPQKSAETAGGQEILMDRRSMRARRNAVGSSMRHMLAQRMPGSRDSVYLKALRTSAGVPLDNISDNPSYREIMAAMAVDRFTTGFAAGGLIKDQSNIEHDKLITSVFYLMLLRDYYEVMERWALSLSVETALEADIRKDETPVSAAPSQG